MNISIFDILYLKTIKILEIKVLWHLWQAEEVLTLNMSAPTVASWCVCVHNIVIM